jgi:nitrate reductase gamma subunit
MRKHLAVFLILAGLAAGCVNPHRPVHPHGMPPGQAKKIAHVHGSACGHVLVDGVWVVVE